MVFLGIDWAEAHHDVCLLDEQGKLLGKRRVVDGLEGVRQLHELVAEQVPEPEQVVVGIETDRGLLVQSLVATGYQVYAINPPCETTRAASPSPVRLIAYSQIAACCRPTSATAPPAANRSRYFR